MGDEPKRVLDTKAHRFARGGEAVVVLSILLLVPYLRRRRGQRHARWFARVPIPGH
jgi:hypothetical protein